MAKRGRKPKRPEERQEQVKTPEEQKRESGMPGGGQARIDEVGRSGVYPASGPLPPSPDAPVRGQASWGQGERGAEGYEDSGTSEIRAGGGKAQGGVSQLEDECSRRNLAERRSLIRVQRDPQPLCQVGYVCHCA